MQFRQCAPQIPPKSSLPVVRLLIIFLLVSAPGAECSRFKIFSQCFSQATRTSSKILHIGDQTVAIFNPVNLKIGIFRFSATLTSNFITMNGNISNYVHGNFIYNRYGAQGIANRDMFTLIGDQFYDGIMLAYAGTPKIWKVIASEFVLKLMPDNILWLTHWRNLKYAKVCNTSNLNVSAPLANILANSKQELFLFYQNGQLLRLSYNESIDNYTAERLHLPNAARDCFNYSLSVDSSYLFYSEGRHVLKFEIKKQQFALSLMNNFTLTCSESIAKISYNENNENFIILLSNSSFRICGFSWGSCYHLTGRPTEQITPQMESPNFLVRDFEFKNLTHFGVITYDNQFELYQTVEFTIDALSANLEWPDGTVNGSPLTDQLIFTDSPLPDFKYPALDFDESEEDFSHLSTSTVAIVYLISLPQARKVFVFLNPLYMLLENFWFYSYQNRNFRPVVNRTFSIMRVINQVKLFPLPFYSIQNELKSSVNFDQVTKSDFTDVSPYKFTQIQGNDVSFLKNIQDSFIWGSLYTLMNFLLMKGLSRVPFKSKAVREFFRSKSHNAGLFVALIQSNTQFYAFMGFSQLRIAGQLEQGDKVKLVAAIIVLFILTFYCIAGLMIVAGVFRNCWSVFVEERKRSRRSLWFSVIWLTLQSLLTGVLNGLFQENASMLQLMIIGVDGCCLICVLVFWSTAQSYISNILLVLYLIFKLCFDIVIYLPDIDEWVESFLIAAIILTILYSVFWSIAIIYQDSCEILQQINKTGLSEKAGRHWQGPKQSKKVSISKNRQVIFKTFHIIEGEGVPSQKPKSIASYLAGKYDFVAKTRNLLNKIVNDRNVDKDTHRTQKRVSLKCAEGQAKSTKMIKKQNNRVTNCVSGQISTKGEIRLEFPEKSASKGKEKRKAP